VRQSASPRDRWATLPFAAIVTIFIVIPAGRSADTGTLTQGYGVVTGLRRWFLFNSPGLWLWAPRSRGRLAPGNFGVFMTNPTTTSLLDRANLDRDSVRHQIARGLKGADDGELFLE